MSLNQEVNLLQTDISKLIEQSGIPCKSINLSLRSIESGFDRLSISWSFPHLGEVISFDNMITQDQLLKNLHLCILNTGLKPFHYSLSIQIENMDSLDLTKWKIKTINRNYLKTHKKISGVVCEIQFISMRQ